MSTNEISAILADPKAHGFTFSTETVKQDGRPYAAEIVVVEDLAKFEASFPGVALRACNGQSIRVGSQAISRNAHGKEKPDMLRERNVKWLLGIEEPTTKTVYKVFVDGEWLEFTSQEEAEAAVQELQSA